MIDKETYDILASSLHAFDRTNWSEIAKRMNKITGETASANAWRKRAEKYAKHTNGNAPNTKTPRTESRQSTDLCTLLLQSVGSKPKSIVQVRNETGMDLPDINTTIDELEHRGYTIHEASGMIWQDVGGAPTYTERADEWDGKRTIKLLVISDTHLCNKCQQLQYLNEAYDDAVATGCDYAFHLGDLTDGYYQNRPGHIYELHRVGFDDQLDYVVANYPKRKKKDGTDFRTRIISGNHDHTHMMNGGANIVKAVSRQRDDIEFLGDSFCKVWITPNCDIDLQHPGDGSAYAYSYASQKLVDALQGGEKPKIMLIGHHHKNMYYSYRNIHVFEVPCLEAQTPFEKAKKIAVTVGWWIVTVEVSGDGTVERLIPEFRQKYVMLKNDY